jgi:hypothetical protein
MAASVCIFTSLAPRHSGRVLGGATRSTKARRKFLILAVLLLVGIGAWWIPISRPTIQFSGLHETPDGDVAVFLVTNSTASPFSYVSAYASTKPFDYVYRVQLGGDWKTCVRVTSGAAEARVLAPYASFQFTAEPPFDDYSKPFAVGVEFFCGTPDEVCRRNTNILARCWRRLRSATGFYRQPDYTWSEVAKR